MAASGISQPRSRSRRRHVRRGLEARIKRALRELPLDEGDITAVARKLCGKLARFRGDSIWNNPAFFDIKGKVTAISHRFARQGLTLDDYLRVARRQPQLLITSPAIVIARIERVVAHFSRYELTLPCYLHAAMKAPPLFGMSSASVIANVEAVLNRFAGDGLTPRQYLQAALIQPRLFYQPSDTTIRHLGYLIEMYRQGLLTFPGEPPPPPEQPLAPLFAFLSRWPMCLTYADDNLALRLRYAQVTGEHPEGTELLRWPRRRIEQALARALENAHNNQR
jgi:hypothetical protein